MSGKLSVVIGGCGFIGRSLVKKLSESQSSQVVVVGRSQNPRSSLPDGVDYISCGALDGSGLSSLLKQADDIIDLAYGTVPKTSFEDPLQDVMSNLPSAVSLLQAASRSCVKRYLLVSSGGTVYGHSRYLPIDENHPNDPVSPYGISKLLTEKYALFFHRMEGLPVVIARPGNPYGVEQVGRQQQGFIGAAIHSLMKGHPLEVFGERGTVRDYIYIEDLVSGLLALLSEGKAGEIYNVGTGIGHDNSSVLEVLEAESVETGKKLHIIQREARLFDVQANVLDCSKLHAISTWRPKVSLREGIRMTLAEVSKRGLIQP